VATLLLVLLPAVSSAVALDAAGAGTEEPSAAVTAHRAGVHDELGSPTLIAVLPPFLVEIRVLEIALWQWIGLLLLVLIAYALAWLTVRLLVAAVAPLAIRLDARVVHALVQESRGAMRLGGAVLFFSVGRLLLALPASTQGVFAGLEKAATIVVVTWVLVRVADVLGAAAVKGLAARGRTTAVGVVPIGRRIAKGIVFAFALLAILQNVGVNVTGILAGLGIGGLAVALAAQKTVENLFGGLTLILDQPVRVGDFCRFGDRVGIVEEVGLRSTRVRTLDRTVVSVPNAEFATLQLENFSRRDRIWFHPTLRLRYETTPDQLRHVLVEIRKMLYAHPKIDPDPARIRFVGFGAYSLDLEVFAYVLTSDYGEFLAIQEDVALRIMDIVAASGTAFALPSQTAYLAAASPLDEGRRDAAEAEVRAWRARGESHLPEFPPEAIARLRNTIVYPGDGVQGS
jgi:MscS family membrane protein